MSDKSIVVIGAGAAGTSAALSAVETAGTLGKDVKVTVLEKTDEPNWGGNSRWTTANFRMIDNDHLYSSFEEDIIRDSKNMADKDYVHRLAVEALDTIKWIQSKGVHLEPRPDNWTYSGFKIGPVGGGLEIITALREHCERSGVQILFETTAYKLLQDESGVVTGVWTRAPNGKMSKRLADVVILAGGGFEGNREMLTKYIDTDANYFRMDVPATQFHTGECINMAFEIGAAPSGEFGCYHGDVVDARSHSYRPTIRSYVYGILVNKRGERFIDEGMDEMSNSFEFVAREIFKQPDHIAYLILDNRVNLIPGFDKSLKTTIQPYKAKDIAELADVLKIPEKKLLETVKEFNQSVAPGQFDPSKNDGKHTHGIYPPKSNWALEIKEQPFLCYPVEGTMQFTWGGVASDSQGRVLTTNGSPISGLYAAGEVVGFYYHHYTPGTSVLRALTYGRIAGSESVRWIFGE